MSCIFYLHLNYYSPSFLNGLVRLGAIVLRPLLTIGLSMVYGIISPMEMHIHFSCENWFRSALVPIVREAALETFFELDICDR